MTKNTEFKVGDIVNATDKGEFYYGLPNCDMNIDVTEFDLYQEIVNMDNLTVILVGKHFDTGNTLYLLENKEGRFVTDNETGHMTLVSRPEPKEPKFNYVRVKDSIFSLKAEFEAGELFSQLLGDSGEYRVIEEELALTDEYGDHNIYRRVERTEEDELLEVLCNSYEGWNKRNIKGETYQQYLAKSGKIQLYRQ